MTDPTERKPKLRPHLVAPPRLGEGSGGVALLLHGGRENSRQGVTPFQLPVLRMIPFGWAIRRLRPDLTVARLQFRLRGWNGECASPVADALWALDEIQDRYGRVPVVLVGHSMGGRTAMRAAAHPSVLGMVGLAPWLPGTEPVDGLAGKDLVVLHGTRDHTTSASASLAFTERAAGIARQSVYVQVARSGHTMLRRARRWHRLTAAYVAAMLDDAPLREVVPDATQRRDSITVARV
ncbi:MAG: hypothetical protein JWL73_2203 [Actinomycetia bacterium]|nr:hypothetical protein [Actinomycetes bacterium]